MCSVIETVWVCPRQPSVTDNGNYPPDHATECSGSSGVLTKYSDTIVHTSMSPISAYEQKEMFHCVTQGKTNPNKQTGKQTNKQKERKQGPVTLVKRVSPGGETRSVKYFYI